MIIIPLKQIPSQNLKITLNNQVCSIAVKQKGPWLYLDLALPAAQLLTGRLCLNRVLLVRQAYLGFVGDLSIVDQQGVTDPGANAYQQLYTPGGQGRYALVYLSPEDL